MTLSEMQTQLDAVCQQSENTTKELASIKELLQDLLVQKQTQTNPPEHVDPSGSSSSLPNHALHLRDPEPSDLTDITKQQPSLAQQRPPPTSGALATRIGKIEFPKFKGSLLHEWICLCEQFFVLDNTAPELKVRLASLHLEGKALQWHHTYMSSRYDQYPPWSEYIMAISTRFGKLFDDPLADLVSIKQAFDSVECFMDKFECALTRLTLSDAYALSIFLTNMQPHLAYHVRQFNPNKISEAARLARLHESSLLHTPNRYSRAPFIPNPKPQPPNHTPSLSISTPLLPPPNTNNSTTKPQPNHSPFPSHITKPGRKFSYEEMQQRRAKGLCMFCDEQFSPGHHLKHKHSQIYVLECEDTEVTLTDDTTTLEFEEQEPADTPLTLSVNALDGSSSFMCMRVIGKYGKRNLHILIDTGSSHNFIDLQIAKDLGCLLEPIPPVEVSAANGNNMLSNFCCKKFTWSMQGYQFTTEVRTLPLDCCDMVLGVQWLFPLGKIG